MHGSRSSASVRACYWPRVFLARESRCRGAIGLLGRVDGMVSERGIDVSDPVDPHEEIRRLRNRLIAARSLLSEHTDDEVRIWNPKRGGWKALRADGAYVDSDPPDGMGDYAAGWRAAHKQIVNGLASFRTETGISASAAVGVMQKWINGLSME